MTSTLNPQVTLLLQHRLQNMRDQQRRMKHSLIALEADAASLKLFIQATCEHEFKAIKGYEHEGGLCSRCGLNAMSERVVVAAFEAKVESHHSIGDLSNVCSSD